MGKGTFFVTLSCIGFIKALVGAWMLATLWAWFIMEPFSAPALTLHTAFGIMCIVDFLIFKASDLKLDEKETDETRLVSFTRALLIMVSVPIFVMTFAFVGHKFLA